MFHWHWLAFGLLRVPDTRKTFTDFLPLTDEAAAELDRDRLGIRPTELDPKAAIRVATQWICRAQEHSSTNDGGVARHFSLNTGWGASYPETTGYIIETLLECAKYFDDSTLTGRVSTMLEFLIEIQSIDGSFPGGIAGEKPVVPVVFNTGQILIGLAAAVKELGDEYRVSMNSAAEWLVENQEPDGAWRKHHSPFAGSGARAYDTHVAIGLLRAAAIDANKRFETAGLNAIRYCMSFQDSNGFIRNCCLTDKKAPLTHTLGYYLRGVVEGYLHTKSDEFLKPALKNAYGLGSAVGKDGFLAGRLDKKFRPVVDYACLTGSVQIAESFLHLYRATGDQKLLDWGILLNQYVRRTMRDDGTPAGAIGGVKGVYPINGRYNSYQYLNWAAKFFIDSQMLELEIFGELGR